MSPNNQPQPDTDQILHYLTSAARSIVKDIDNGYSPEGKRTITHIYNWLRGDLMAGNLAEYEKSYDDALRKYPDEASELYDVMYEHAGLGMEGTYEEFMAKCTDNGMAEGIGSTIKRGIKNIKRGMQGWGQLNDIPDDDPRLLPGAKDSPRQLVARNKGYDDKTVRQLARPIKSSYPFGGDDTTSPHSPRGLQKRVLDREMKKRGLGEDDSSDINQKIEFHKQGQASAQYKGGMNKMHAAKIKELEAKLAALKKQTVKEDASCGATSAGAFATGAVGAVKPKKINRRKSAVGEGIDQVDEGYWDYAVKAAEKAREERKGKPFEKNPASHDKNGVYKGDKDLDGNPVPPEKKVKEFKAPESHPFNKRTDAELKGFVKDAPEAAASIKKRGGNPAKIEKDAVTASVIKQSRQNNPRK